MNNPDIQEWEREFYKEFSDGDLDGYSHEQIVEFIRSLLLKTREEAVREIEVWARSRFRNYAGSEMEAKLTSLLHNPDINNLKK